MKIGPKEMQLIAQGLKLIAENHDALGKLLENLDLDMPNWKMKTLGGRVFWVDLVSAADWRVQRNRVFGNCRILNDQNERVAWGGESAMIRAFKKIAEH